MSTDFREMVVWHIDIDTSGAALQRLAVALLKTGSALLPSRLIMGELGRGTSAFLVVQIPADSLTRFCELCKPMAFRLPPRVDVGYRCDLAPTSNQPPVEAELRDRDGKPLHVGDRVTFICYWGGLPSPPRTGTVRAIGKTEARVDDGDPLNADLEENGARVSSWLPGFRMTKVEAAP